MFAAFLITLREGLDAVYLFVIGSANWRGWRAPTHRLVRGRQGHPVTAYLALNFTGSSTYTCRTGVQREIFAYIPAMATTFGVGIVLSIALGVYRWIGGAG